ncbi:MAG: CPBP family intramembrane metalloprotease [Actinomycetota bacterium]|nr:CPBP family intramembrane metalloprotease [Actinomycetota bacterium]
MDRRPPGDHTSIVPETGRTPGGELDEQASRSPDDDLAKPWDRGGLSAGRAFAIFLAYIAVQLVAGAGVGFVYGFWSVASGAGFPEDIPGVWLLAGGAAGVIAGGVAIFVMTRKTLMKSSAGLSSIGWKSASNRDVGTGVVIGLALPLLVLPAVTAIFPPPSEDALSPLARAASGSGAAQVILVVLALLLAPPIEEFLFRGVMLSGFSRSWGRAAAGMGVTALFALAHLVEMANYVPALLVIAIVGAAALAMRWRSGSLIPAIAVHGTYNLTMVVFFLVFA